MKFIKVSTNYYNVLINIEKIESVYQYTESNSIEVAKPEQWLIIQTHNDSHKIPNFTLKQFQSALCEFTSTVAVDLPIKIHDLTGNA